MEGIYQITPSIKKISFEQKGKIFLYLEDGRIIISPLKYFPGIQHLDSKQRKIYTIMDDQMIMFKDSDSIYHLQDFIGKEQNYRYRG